MELEPTTSTLHKAIQAISTQVGSLQDQGQGRPSAPAGPLTPPDQQGGQANTPKTARPGRQGLGDPFQPIRSTVGYNSEEEEPKQENKKEPCRASQGLSSLTPFDEGTSTKQPKMELPDPYKGNTRGQKPTQWLDHMLLWVALHQNQFDEEEQMVVWILYHMEDKAADWSLPPINNIIKGKGSAPNTIKALGACFKEAFADPDTKRAAAWKIATLTQTASTAEYVTKFCNLIKVKELVSTKDHIPNKLEAIFAASVIIDNTCWENKENCPKKTPTKALVTAYTSTTTTTHRVHLSDDPNYVTLEERDCHCTAGLCVKCGQKGHRIKQCPNSWKATIKDMTKVLEVEELGKD
ncbi:hypothetical protein RhiTH_003640 [Rhizoctonia solani]